MTPGPLWLDAAGVTRFNSALPEGHPGLLMDLTEGQVAQSVEQRTENPRVDSSILSLATNFSSVNTDQMIDTARAVLHSRARRCVAQRLSGNRRYDIEQHG